MGKIIFFLTLQKGNEIHILKREKLKFLSDLKHITKLSLNFLKRLVTNISLKEILKQLLCQPAEE
ncbi:MULTISPECIES: hypothetical protein [Leptospira]|uniref:Uncharacterized protein n=1 Tax=Leptospira kirschneri serovar Pomona TaxID=561005 RepID=A0A1T1E350_9LEPT|nr:MULTISPECIES: hypothetical protein [Leptospira]EKP04547.1 hypothetical protein LEP1GSC018_0212 [Leptospira kirschneri str. 2008720114]EMJ92404.1 hypothetical protein LEP1GSC198_2596 [Leptospira kirschneri str. JB]EMK07772.1 hypothetical protein LEP1GSC166_1765 [Leptospira kirschneri]KXZ28308.1 hypothetical protein AYB32_12865 [Leptospira kirschneri]KXZ33856.1 hypothetical protein AYB34_10305 [Leptospira sp. ZV016]